MCFQLLCCGVMELVKVISTTGVPPALCVQACVEARQAHEETKELAASLRRRLDALNANGEEQVQNAHLHQELCPHSHMQTVILPMCVGSRMVL